MKIEWVHYDNMSLYYGFILSNKHAHYTLNEKKFKI